MSTKPLMNHQLFSQLIHYLNSNPSQSIKQIQKKLHVEGSSIEALLSQLQQLGLSIVSNENDEIFLTEIIQPLSVELIKKNLPENMIGQLDFLPVFLTIDSTNQYLKNTKVDLSDQIRICLSEHQASGRGRRSKRWVSPLGSNIYLSLHVRLNMPLKQIGGLSLIAGISMINGLSKLGINALKIKWPNDIYWNDKKLAGILIESTRLQENCAELIIGIGINIDMPKTEAQEIDQDWVDLNHIAGNKMCRNIVIAAVIEQLISNLDLYQDKGLEAFMSQWQAHDYLFQKNIIVKLPDEKTKRGIAMGIDERGELLMRSDNRIERLHAGDISVRKVQE